MKSPSRNVLIFMVAKNHEEEMRTVSVILLVLPMTITFIDLEISGASVSVVATFAAIQEWHYIRTGRCEIGNNKTQIKRRIAYLRRVSRHDRMMAEKNTLEVAE